MGSRVNEHSAEWLRGAVAVARDVREPLAVAHYTLLLAAAEAREASQPTAEECELGTYYLDQEVDGQRTQPTAAEVIEACEKALGTAECYLCIYENEQRHRDNWEGSEDQGILRADKDANAAALALCARWKEANGGK